MAFQTTQTDGFSNRVLSFYNKQLLQAIQLNLRLSNYARQQSVPKSTGFNGIRFFRPRRASRVGVGALTKGTVPGTLNDVNVGYIDIKLAQRGSLAKISDIVTATDLLDTLDVYSKTLGADAALDLESVNWHAICSLAGTADADGTANPIPAGQKTLNGSNTMFERFAGVVQTGNSANDYNTFRAQAVGAASVISRAVHLGAMTQLKINGIPMINGKYVCVIPSPVLMDMRKDTTWTNTAQFNPDQLLWKWAQFELDGAVFVEAMRPDLLFIEDASQAANVGYGVHAPAAANTASASDAGAIYSTLYLGEDAFGIPKMVGDAGSDPATPSLKIVKNPDSGNPLGQFIFVGWKAFYMSALLWTSETSDVPHVVQLRTRTTFF
jgi:N4-gp56 family major capsid protein